MSTCYDLLYWYENVDVVVYRFIHGLKLNDVILL